MSENIKTVQSIYEAFGRGDVPTILSHLSPDIEWEHDSVDHGVPWLKPGTGLDHVKGFFQALAEGVEVTHFEPRNFLTGGNQVAVPIKLEAVSKTNGRTFKDIEMHLWTFGEDGKVSGFRHHTDTVQHWQAANLKKE